MTVISRKLVHGYGGIEHSQEGPFADCLLCRIEALEGACRAASYALLHPEGGFNREEALQALHDVLPDSRRATEDRGEGHG